tara:strand:- start:111441 stop:111830 length:390 start_codon:yes stop_codon:yes gene_type:complete
MKDISLKAVAISSVSSFVLMIVFITLLGTAYGAVQPAGMSEEEIAVAFATSWVSMLSLLAVVLAGALGARIAGKRHVLHGALSASLNVIWGIFCLIFLMPLSAMMVLTLLANPLLGALGGYIYLSLRKD